MENIEDYSVNGFYWKTLNSITNNILNRTFNSISRRTSNKTSNKISNRKRFKRLQGESKEIPCVSDFERQVNWKATAL